MGIFQIHHRLDLYHLFILHYKISSAGAHFNALVKYRVLLFPYIIQTRAFQLNSQAALINDLLKSGSQGIMQLHRTVHDRESQFLILLVSISKVTLIVNIPTFCRVRPTEPSDKLGIA